MLAEVNSFLQVMIITIGTFMIERYVLLEPPMARKKQQLFYIISFALVMILAIFIGTDANYLTLVLGGLNIVLGRKKHRLPGFLLVFPLVGIMNGVAAPVFFLPLLVAGDTDSDAARLTEFGVYIVIGLLLALFYFMGKNWRKWFRENLKDRRPLAVEYVLIIVTGILVTVFKEMIQIFGKKAVEVTEEVTDYVTGFSVVYYITAFILTLTLMVLIMQGNKRKFYHDKVSDMQFSVIATMADIVENRDENTGGHIKRTAKYVEIIGRKLRSAGEFAETLTEEYLSDMIVAAPLHDIGKIHIPDAILNKPGRLTDEEFAIMKTHAAAGRDVLLKAKKQLGDFDYLNIAVEMAEYHHEWWNGKGYPNAISGEEIPLCARIMAVADVFDALTAKRCYKAAMPLEKAYKIIEEETGTHFDPVVAKAFLASKRETEEAIRELSS